MDAFAFVPIDIVGSMVRANVAFVGVRSLNTFIQLSLMVDDKGERGVATGLFDVGDEMPNAAFAEGIALELDAAGLISSMALSRKRVSALFDERRNARSSLLVRMMVRG